MEPRAKSVARRTIYESDWVNLYTDKVVFPAGRIVEEHHCIDYQRQGIATVVTNEADEILLIRSYRYIFDSIEWEIPAGGFDPEKENVLEAAAREVAEETGCRVKDLRKIYTYYPMIGVSSGVFHIALARKGAQHKEFDRNEVHEIRWVSRDKVQSMIENREIKDGFSLTGILLYLQLGG